MGAVDNLSEAYKIAPLLGAQKKAHHQDGPFFKRVSHHQASNQVITIP